MVEIKMKFPKWKDVLDRKAQEINIFIAAIMQTNRALLFDSAGSHNGRAPWAKLKFRRGVPLSDRGTLRKSLTANSDGAAGPDGLVRFSGDTVTIGTKLMSARLMNDGTTKMPDGVLRPVNAKALKIPVNPQELSKIQKKGTKDVKKKMGIKGNKKEGFFIFRKWVRIPARQFDTWNLRDEEEMNEALTNKISEILSEAQNV